MQVRNVAQRGRREKWPEALPKTAEDGDGEFNCFRGMTDTSFLRLVGKTELCMPFSKEMRDRYVEQM